jgi:hypothetical protein
MKFNAVTTTPRTRLLWGERRSTFKGIFFVKDCGRDKRMRARRRHLNRIAKRSRRITREAKAA